MVNAIRKSSYVLLLFVAVGTFPLVVFPSFESGYECSGWDPNVPCGPGCTLAAGTGGGYVDLTFASGQFQCDHTGFGSCQGDQNEICHVVKKGTVLNGYTDAICDTPGVGVRILADYECKSKGCFPDPAPAP